MAQPAGLESLFADYGSSSTESTPVKSTDQESQLTPRSRVRRLLYQVSDDDEDGLDDAPVVPRNKTAVASGLEENATYASARRRMLLMLAKTNATESATENTTGNATENATGNATEDESESDSNKENIRPADNLGPFRLDSDQSDHSDSSPDAVVRPDVYSSESDSDADLSHTGNLMDDPVFLANAAKLRAERTQKLAAAAEKRRKAEEVRAAIEKELETERLREEKLAAAHKPRKASKKALEQMNRETARIQRNRQLVLQPVVKRKITMEGVLALFDPPAPVQQQEQHDRSSSSQPMRDDTPPTSPRADYSSDSDANLDSVEDLFRKSKDKKLQEQSILLPKKTITTPVKRELQALRASLPPDTLAMLKAAKERSRKLLDRAIARVSDDEDDTELEILPPGVASAKKTVTKVTLENVVARKRVDVPTYKRFSGSSSKSPSKDLRKRGYMTDFELEETLQKNIREQARKEKEDKIKALLARGGHVLTTDDKRKEDEIVENLLERERKNAAEARRRDKLEKKRNGETEETFIDDDEDEDEEYEEFEDEDLAELSEDIEVDSDSEEAVEDSDDGDKDREDTDNKDLEDREDKEIEDQEDKEKEVEDQENIAIEDSGSKFSLPGISDLFAPTQVDSQRPVDVSQNLQVVTPVEDFSRHYRFLEETAPVETHKHRYNSPDPSPELMPKTKVSSFSKRLLAQTKKSREMKEMFDEHAEESDDEWAGVGGASESEGEDDEPDSELDEMVNDDIDSQAGASKVAALFAADELEKDEKLVNAMMKGVHGGFRKRQSGNGLYDLSDSDDEAAYAERRRQRREAKKRKSLLEDEKISSLMKNPLASAFFNTIGGEEIVDESDREYVDADGLHAILSDDD